MKTQPLGNSGIDATVIGLGTWAIGGFMWGGTDEKESIAAIQAALDQGITLVDSAPAYGFGLAEELVGKAIRGRRDDVILATKCGLVWDDASLQRNLKQGRNPLRRSLRPDSIRRELENSLRRLRTDHVDLYQTHWPHAETPIEDTMGALLELKEEGKLRAIGVSNVSLDQLKTYLKVGLVDSDQERYSMLDRKQEEEKLPFLAEEKIA
ncbi:MAG: aldo/keto reductase, partial [Kiritimatiellae bacterium]|nr:aldo/keto reductase [Kiritimatiellia bacterium]